MCPALTHLELERCELLPTPVQLPAQTRLQRLCITGSALSSHGAHLAALQQLAPGLSSLQLEWTSMAPTDLPTALGRQLTELQLLSESDQRWPSLQLIEALGAPFTNLQLLRLEGLSSMVALKPQISGMSYLRSLQLPGCAVHRAQDLSTLTLLTTLELKECYGLVHLPDSIQKLTLTRVFSWCLHNPDSVPATAMQIFIKWFVFNLDDCELVQQVATSQLLIHHELTISCRGSLDESQQLEAIHISPRIFKCFLGSKLNFGSGISSADGIAGSWAAHARHYSHRHCSRHCN
jgi:hypothetical protein